MIPTELAVVLSHSDIIRHRLRTLDGRACVGRAEFPRQLIVSLRSNESSIKGGLVAVEGLHVL